MTWRGRGGSKRQLDTDEMFRRSYICSVCGALKRAAADYLSRAASAPSCCGSVMRLLFYEQTVAAVSLPKAKRAAWLANGAQVERRRGRKRWRAIEKA
jgi:hypothetical protein